MGQPSHAGDQGLFLFLFSVFYSPFLLNFSTFRYNLKILYIYIIKNICKNVEQVSEKLLNKYQKMLNKNSKNVEHVSENC